jgi:hypothetical protein
MDGLNTSALATEPAVETESQLLLQNNDSGHSAPQTGKAIWGFYLYSWAIEARLPFYSLFPRC